MHNEDPKILYGRLLESVHLSGYTFDRLCSELELLLADDRWKITGEFKSINDFLRTIDLSAFRLGERRPELVRKIKELHPEASNRALAAAVGVDEKTVRNDVSAENSAVEDIAVNRHADEIFGTAENSAPEDSSLQDIADPEPAQPEPPPNPVAVARKAAEDKRKAILEVPADPEILPGVYIEDFFTGADRIADESVDLVFTDPPYDKNSVDLYRKAAKVAARILKPGGSFIAYSGQKYLPEVYGLINHPALRYWWTFAGVHAGGNQMLQKLGIRCGWKPIVWYVKGTRGDVSEVLLDVVTGAREKSDHEWQQAEAEALHFIEKLTFPNGLVVDFFLGSGTTKVAADALGRRFIGFEIDDKTAQKAAQRINEEAA